MQQRSTERATDHWATVTLENGLTAGQYAQDLRGADPRKPEKTYDQIRAFLAEQEIPVSENQVRTYFRKVGQTAPYPGQATDTTRYLKGDKPLPPHPWIVAHPEFAKPLAPIDGEMRTTQAMPGNRLIVHHGSTIGLGTIGDPLVTARPNADGSTTLSRSDGTQVTAHRDGSFSGIGSTQQITIPGNDPLWSLPVQVDDFLPVHEKVAPPTITPVDDGGATKTIGQVESDFFAEIAEEFGPENDAEYLEDLVETERRKQESARDKRILQQYVKERSALDMFVDAVKDFIVPIEYPDFTPYIGPKLPPTAPNRAAVLLLSDMHAGKKTVSFNRAVIEERLTRLVNETLSAVEKERTQARVDELHLLLLGDIADGALIYPTQPYHAEANVLDQIFDQASPMLANAIRTLSTAFKKVTIATVPGNHGRGQKGMHERDNIDNMIYNVLRLSLSSVPNLEWNLVTHWYNIHPVMNTNILMTHGHQSKIAYSVPFYSICRKVLGWFLSLKSQGSFDIATSGHFHTPNHININDVDAIMNGAFVTDDDFALEVLAAKCEPAQTLLFIDERDGLVGRQIIKLR